MPETSSSLSLAVGDRVVYPNQGLCRVSGVETKEVAGQKLTFITMRREEDGAVVMVPQGKVHAIGLRKLATAKDVTEVFAFLKSDSDKADLDWKQRARTNLDRMSQGGLLGLAEVVKGLQVLSELRPLPAKERELYDTARHLLVTEISAATGMSECNAEDSIDVILFPPGKERPKRTVAEFQTEDEGGDDDLGMADDLLPLDGELEELAPVDDAAEAEEASEEGAEEKEKAEPKRAKASAKATKRLSDDEETEPAGEQLKADALQKAKRGRPPKSKTIPIAVAPAPRAAEPAKKRGRPPKPKAKEAPPAAKRGRPAKAKPVSAAKAKPKGKKK